MLLAFVENLRDRLVAQGLIGDDEFQRLTAAVKRHIEEPDTLVTGTIFFLAWGAAVPRSSVTHDNWQNTMLPILVVPNCKRSLGLSRRQSNNGLHGSEGGNHESRHRRVTKGG
jgi:hypothetical protein